MTDVDFHFNASDRLAYACRLLRKAVRKGSGVAVTGPSDRLDQLDRLLWTFDDTEFVPHLRLRPSQDAPAPRQRRTPVWLLEQAELAVHLPVLLNLGDEPVQGFETFARLIEVVDRDPAAREAARARWRHYQRRGYPLNGYEVTA